MGAKANSLWKGRGEIEPSARGGLRSTKIRAERSSGSFMVYLHVTVWVGPTGRWDGTLLLGGAAERESPELHLLFLHHVCT